MGGRGMRGVRAGRACGAVAGDGSHADLVRALARLCRRPLASHLRGRGGPGARAGSDARRAGTSGLHNCRRALSRSRVVGKLVAALDAIDYPRAKLDIKLVLERRDRETLAALAAMKAARRYDVIVAPLGLR